MISTKSTFFPSTIRLICSATVFKIPLFSSFLFTSKTEKDKEAEENFQTDKDHGFELKVRYN